MLQQSAGVLLDAHDLVMFDLDGVVYVGGKAIDGVPEHIARVREEGRHIAFVTNNASRTPADVVARLADVGVAAEASDVVTSAQAAARLLAQKHGAGASVVLLGGKGLGAALAEEGLKAVDPSEPGEAVAVVSGYGKDVRWRDIMRAAVLVRDGLPYVASNADLTIPTAYGLAPGHGVLVRTISEFAGVEPIVAGKPERPLMEETIRRVGGSTPLMVGDRLDTDIEGANAVGAPSVLVLTGVTWLEELAGATAELRPSYVSPGLEGLFEAHQAPEIAGPVARLGGWQATISDGRLDVSGDGSVTDWWRVAVTACWLHLDAAGAAADVSGVVPPGPERASPSE